MKTKHTPTPWRQAGSGLQIKAKENGYLVAVVEGPDRRARGKEWQEDHDYCHGNAAFIVRACNSHASWAKWIVQRGPGLPDHACAECVPGGELVKAGFQCVYHEALAAAGAQ